MSNGQLRKTHRLLFFPSPAQKHTHWQFQPSILPDRSKATAWPLKDSSNSRTEWGISCPRPDSAHKPGCLSYSITNERKKQFLSSSICHWKNSPLPYWCVSRSAGLCGFQRPRQRHPDGPTWDGAYCGGVSMVPYKWNLRVLLAY